MRGFKDNQAKIQQDVCVCVCVFQCVLVCVCVCVCFFWPCFFCPCKNGGINVVSFLCQVQKRSRFSYQELLAFEVSLDIFCDLPQLRLRNFASGSK